MVHAASSGAGMEAIRDESPTATSVVIPKVADDRRERGPLRGLERAGEDTQGDRVETLAVVRPALADRDLRETARRLDELNVVQGHQGL